MTIGKQKFTCINCGLEYESYKPESKYCSRECRKDYLTVLYNCDFCKKEIRVNRCIYNKLINGTQKKIYCSKECSNKGQVTLQEKKCVNCGETFTIIYAFKDIQKYCSKKCYKEHRQRARTIKICPQCGNSFVARNASSIYCSKECANNALKKKIKCTCEQCGKVFERKESEVVKNNLHFCSFDCKIQYISWSQADIKVLEEYYGKAKISEIRLLLSKPYTNAAVKSKALSLGLAYKQRWTAEEDRILLDNYSKVPMHDILKMLPSRTLPSVLRRAHIYKLKSYHYITKLYSTEEIKYLYQHHKETALEDMAAHLNRSAHGVEQKLTSLGLSYKTFDGKYYSGTNGGLNKFVRNHLSTWRNDVLKSAGFECCLTGQKENLVVHHCRGFNVLIQETIDALNFTVKNSFQEYTPADLENFLDVFLDLQESYGEYVCITEYIHRLFHKHYGYGDNTRSQWNEFVKDFNNEHYKNAA